MGDVVLELTRDGELAARSDRLELLGEVAGLDAGVVERCSDPKDVDDDPDTDNKDHGTEGSYSDQNVTTGHAVA
jgi:hypothetical protein